MKAYKVKAQFLWNAEIGQYLFARSKSDAKKLFIKQKLKHPKVKEFTTLLINSYKIELGVDPRKSITKTKKTIRTLTKNKRYALSICIEPHYIREV